MCRRLELLPFGRLVGERVAELAVGQAPVAEEEVEVVPAVGLEVGGSGCELGHGVSFPAGEPPCTRDL